MNAKNTFTFIIGALIYIGRAIKHDAGSTPLARTSIDAGALYMDEAQRVGIAPTDEDMS